MGLWPYWIKFPYSVFVSVDVKQNGLGHPQRRPFPAVVARYQNKISAPNAHIVASISDNFPSFFTHLAPLPPLLLLFRTWLVHFFNPYHTRFLHFHKSFFPSRATGFTGRQGGRAVFLPLVVISVLSFLPFQPAGSSSSSRWGANPAFLQLKCVCAHCFTKKRLG